MHNINTEKTVSVIEGMTIGEGIEFFTDLIHFIDTKLLEGIDFVAMTKSKPCLLASGVKKLMKRLDLLVRVENIVCTETSATLRYEVEISLVDSFSGVLRAKAKAICSSDEERYKSSNCDTIYTKAKRRAVTTAILKVACLNEKFAYQDDIPEDTTNYRQSKTERPATIKQLSFLNDLIKRANTDVWAVNQYVQRHYGVKDYHDVSISVASLLIQKFLKACK